jgi:hypothetical protein
MEEKELSIASVSRIRTILLLVGTSIGYLSLVPENLVLAYSMLVVSICMSVYGCYLWTRLKGRHWIWMVCGLLAPAGFLALALLKNKRQETPKPQT